MSFSLTDPALRRLCQINSFEIPSVEMVFFGLRGCLPVISDDSEFRTEHKLEVVACDHSSPRCTLGQWLLANETLAVFPGSTVPHEKHIKVSVQKQGKGTNQMMTGYYRDYRKGIHKNGKPTGHEAFRQTEGHPVRRTADDFDYDNDDRVEVGNPYDNIHAAWSMGIDHNDFASAGCQVVVGYPKCEQRGNKPDAGAWRVFKKSAYDLAQDQFGYFLVTGLNAQAVVEAGSAKVPARLRFGSSGGLVSKIQKRLKVLGFFEGDADGLFERRTTMAVLDYQTATFGANADDGIVGPVTASALGVKWPAV